MAPIIQSWSLFVKRTTKAGVQMEGDSLGINRRNAALAHTSNANSMY
jgi:hypothetical protein